MNNIFNDPKEYIKYFQQIKVGEMNRKSFEGKSMITVWLTQFCNANCAHCFSKTPNNYLDNMTEEHQFSANGIQKLIRFINDSNCSYLMISGGGEPMYCKEAITEIVKSVIVDRLVIVTNRLEKFEVRAQRNGA